MHGRFRHPPPARVLPFGILMVGGVAKDRTMHDQVGPMASKVSAPSASGLGMMQVPRYE